MKYHLPGKYENKAVQELKPAPLHELLHLCLQYGDEETWKKFIHRCQPFIARVISKTLRPCVGIPKANLVDDLVQETYLKLFANNYKALRKFQCDQEIALYGFMKKVAANVTRDYLRGILSLTHDSGREPIPLDMVIDHTGPANAVTYLHRHVLLQEIIRYLKTRIARADSAREHQVFCLYYQQGFTAKEISGLAHLGLTTKGVESMLFRFIRNLRAHFTRIS